MTRIGIALDDVDWHFAELSAAFASLGAEAVGFRLSDCAFTPAGVTIPGFGAALPDAVYARAIAPGGFEEVTRRLGILHALERLGVPVWNSARAVERCVDKSATGFLLGLAGVPTPDAWVVEGEDAARQVVRDHGGARGTLVAKPLFGAQGRGLCLVDRDADLPPAAEMGGVYYLQRRVRVPGEGFHDHRLLMVDGALAGAMTRRSEDWVTNMRRGARAEPLAPDAEMVAVAARAAAAVGADCAGVDLLRDRDGRLWVLEVNSMPGWRGLQGVVDHAIAGRVAAGLLRRVRAGAVTRPATQAARA
ncbi:MAG: ATP-grasp domain-containing protein [Janthinobacterium lividum]